MGDFQVGSTTADDVASQVIPFLITQRWATESYWTIMITNLFLKKNHIHVLSSYYVVEGNAKINEVRWRYAELLWEIWEGVENERKIWEGFEVCVYLIST